MNSICQSWPGSFLARRENRYAVSSPSPDQTPSSSRVTLTIPKPTPRTASCGGVVGGAPQFNKPTLALVPASFYAVSLIPHSLRVQTLGVPSFSKRASILSIIASEGGIEGFTRGYGHLVPQNIQWFPSSSRTT